MKIGVIGAGTMGNGIAQVAAYSGHEVVLQDLKSELLDKAMAAVQKNLRRVVDKKEQESDRERVYQEALGRLKTTRDAQEMADADFVIEAVFENFEVKKSIFERLDGICKAEAVLATNTSSISVTRLAAATSRPQSVIGMHFMNPVPLMKLVEIIRGLASSAETYQRTRDLTLELGKTPVEVKDFPGFISNRILIPMLNEAMTAVMEGVAEAEAIDQVMKLGMNHPMGPLQLADFIGLDVCLDIMNVLFDGFKDSKYRPCPLLQQMVDAGWLGRKSGRGFYVYES